MRSPASLSGLYFNTDVTKSTEVTLSNISALQNLTAVTVEAWIYLFSYPSSNAGKPFGYISGNTGYQLTTNTASGITTIQLSNGTTSVSSGTNATPLNQWVHIAGTWDGSNVRMFYNGVQQGTNQALSGGNTGNPALIPSIGNLAASGRSFPGIISELRISNVARYTANFTPPTAPFTPDANTIGLYHLNEGQGTVAQDSSSQANHGTLTGSPLPVWSGGKFMGGGSSRSLVSANPRAGVQNFPCSLKFDGTSSSLTSPVSPATTGFSLGIWLKTPHTSIPTSNTYLVSWGTTTATDGLTIQFPTSPYALIFQIFSSTTQVLDLQVSVQANRWTHAVFQYQPSGACSIYVNGVVVATGTSTGTMTAPTGQSLSFAKRSYATTYAPCQMQNIVWQNTSTPWTVAQVWALYLNGAIPSGATFAYPLTEGMGTTAYDISGNGNNGTITSGTYTSDVPSRTRGLVGGNLVYNGNFEFAPPTNVAQAGGAGKWLDGTSTGSATNSLFGWAGISTSGTPTFMFDNSTSHSGNYSLKVSTLAIASLAAAANIIAVTNFNSNYYAVLPSTSYTAIYWMKTTANSGTANTGAQLVFREFSGAGAGGTSNTLTGVITTTGWTQYILTFTTASTTRFIELKPTVTGNDGTATLIMDAWFDDIVLTPTVNTTRNTAV